jgi:hypothetical protein
MYLDIGASFIKYEDHGQLYEVQSTFENLKRILENYYENVYVSVQAGAYVTPAGEIKNWGYTPTRDDLFMEAWLSSLNEIIFLDFDYKMAVHGAYLQPNEILVNMGTGGQVTIKGSKSGFESLKIVGCDYTTIRFIPCGKILKYLMDLLILSWDCLKRFTFDELMQNTVICNPAWYPKQEGYPGSFTNLSLENFTLYGLVKATLLGILNRFKDAIFQFECPISKIKLAGGIAEKLPVVKEYFQKNFGNIVEIIPNAAIEGLKRIEKESKQKC